MLICITSQELTYVTFIAFCTSEIGSRGREWDAYTNSIKNIAAYSSFFKPQKRWDICFVHLSSILLPYHKVSYIMEHSQSMWTKKCTLDYNTNGVCGLLLCECLLWYFIFHFDTSRWHCSRKLSAIEWFQLNLRLTLFCLFITLMKYEML